MSGKLTTNLGDAAQTKNILTDNINTTTITDINGNTGLVGQVLSSTALGIDWVAGGGGVPQDLQSVCTVGNTTNTNILMSAGFLQQDPTINILTSTSGNAIKVGFGVGSGVTGTISIGSDTGFAGQGLNSIAIGENAGTLQGIGCVALGNSASQDGQNGSVAVGELAGQIFQGVNSVCIGANSGNDNCQLEAVAIGYNAGFKILGSGAVAIGSGALFDANGVGLDTIAIGHLAMDTPPQFDNNIILNATGASFPDLVTYPVSTGGRCYIGSIRKDDGTHTAPFRAQPVFYDTLSGELFWT